jgi:hypothetical protein
MPKHLSVSVNVKFSLVFALYESNIKFEKGILEYFKTVRIFHTLLTAYLKTLGPNLGEDFPFMHWST